MSVRIEEKAGDEGGSTMRRRGRSSRAAMGLIVIIVMFICILIMVKTDTLSKTRAAKEARLEQINE